MSTETKTSSSDDEKNGSNGRDRVKEETDQTNSNNRSQVSPLLIFGMLFAPCLLIGGGVYHKYGPTFFFGRGFNDSKYSPKEWVSLLQDKTIFLIGGPHRAGTTVFWETVKKHPEVSGFGSTFETGTDFSEGILIQDVYPTFGVGMEKLMANGRTKTLNRGAGRYALLDEKQVHMTEDHRLVTPENFAKVLNRFGQHWNLTAPVLMEKSPPTAVTSRFLQALYNVPIQEAPAATHKTKFLFLTRHPIPNAYAHHHLLGGAHVVPFTKLMDNYVQLHKYLVMDMPFLQNDPMLIYLEDFVEDPSGVLTTVFKWLGVDSSEETVQEILVNGMADKPIKGNINEKYFQKWCELVPSEARDGFVRSYQHKLDSLGLAYQLSGHCDDDKKEMPPEIATEEARSSEEREL